MVAAPPIFNRKLSPGLNNRITRFRYYVVRVHTATAYVVPLKIVHEYVWDVVTSRKLG